MGSDAALLSRIVDTQQQILAALDRIERNQSDPAETRQALADITAGYALTAQLAEVSGVQRAQILEVVTWMRERISGAEQRQQMEQTESLAFIAQQIAPILQGTRDDLVAMRNDLRELRAAIELAIGQLPAGENDTAPIG